jgi:predicted nucleic acid-binding protein
LTDIDEFLAKLPYKLVAAPRRASELISDPKDHPIMNAAILAGVDIIISGDKHFLELELEHPKAMSAAEYLDEIE